MVKEDAGAGPQAATKSPTNKRVPVTRQGGARDEATLHVRTNAWSHGGTFDNQDLLWYAQGVRVMMSRALDDPNSWWFFAAIHGEALRKRSFPGWSVLPAPPQVPTTPVPSKDVSDLYWNQCQHQSWYFPPWHRGYLVALEAQIRAAIVSLGGPSTWALPYWNYFGPGTEYQIPPAFTQATLPDGTPNPLFVKARYGPHYNGDVFVPIPPVSEDCMSQTVYTGDTDLEPGFGGVETTFNHGGGTNGKLENNPHNLVHVKVGGVPRLLGGQPGLMSDPATAALDPIFYLHHANIDRMWAAWNANGHENPTDPEWLEGPEAVGQRKFIMPMPDGSAWVYKPGQVTSLDQMDYTYDDLTLPVPFRTVETMLDRRLMRLGATPTASGGRVGASAGGKEEPELVGAHDGALPITSSGARAPVRIDPKVRRKVTASLAAASPSTPPDRVYLKLENVQGAQDGHTLNVYVNQQLAGTVALFGLRQATERDGSHGGTGLTFVLEITHVTDALHLDGAIEADSLDVRIVPDHAIPEDAHIRVGRISVYRQGQR